MHNGNCPPIFGSLDDLIKNLDEDVYFHYTDEEGIRAIFESQMFKTGIKGRVHFTKDMLSPAEAMNNLFAGFNKTHGGRGDFLIGMKIPREMLSLNDKGELIFNGTLRFDQIQILFGGANPF